MGAMTLPGRHSIAHRVLSLLLFFFNALPSLWGREGVTAKETPFCISNSCQA